MDSRCQTDYHPYLVKKLENLIESSLDYFVLNSPEMYII